MLLSSNTVLCEAHLTFGILSKYKKDQLNLEMTKVKADLFGLYKCWHS
jgi:hypothetical protein